MAAADYDIQDRMGGRNVAMDSRRFTRRFRFDCAANNLAGTKSYSFHVPGKNEVIDKVTVVERTAAGTTATVDVGDEADPNGWVAAANVNGTANALAVPGAAAAYRALTTAQGVLYDGIKDLRVTPSATLSAAVFDVVVEGFSIDNT